MSSNLPLVIRNLPPTRGFPGGKRWQVGDNLGDNLGVDYSALISGLCFVGGRCDNFLKNLCAQDERKKTNIGVERCIGITIGTTCHTCHTCHRPPPGIWEVWRESSHPNPTADRARHVAQNPGPRPYAPATPRKHERGNGPLDDPLPPLRRQVGRKIIDINDKGGGYRG